MKRLSKDEYALMMAYTASLRSEDPYVKVGAVAVTQDGRIIAAGYNGLPPKMTVDDSFWTNRDERRKHIVHAEVNVCALIRRGEAETLAVTTSPCSSCANVIISLGFKRVIFNTVYDKDAEGLNLLRQANIDLIQLPLNDLIKQFLNLSQA